MNLALCRLLLVLLLPAVTAERAVAAIYTDPAAVLSLDIPAKTDAVLAVPIYRSAVFRGKIQSIQPLALGKSHRVTVVAPADWVAGQFVRNASSVPARFDTFGMVLVTGAKEGLWARVLANTEDSVTVELPADESLAGVKTVEADGEGDEIDLVPNWSLASLFRNGVPSGTQLLQMPASAPGINLNPESILVFNGTDWRRLAQSAPSAGAVKPPNPNATGLVPGLNWTGQKPKPGVAAVTSATAASSPPQDHEPLPFGSAFILRNNSVQPMNVLLAGAVPMSQHRRLLRTVVAGLRQDQWIGFSSPVPEPIGALNLGFTDGDELLVFENNAPGQNKAPNQILKYDGAVWRKGEVNVNSTFILQPAQGFVLRKKSTGQPAVFVWQALQSYLNAP